MMSGIQFDTLEAARNLKAAGLEEPHAEAIVTTMSRAVNENMVTKADLKAELSALEQRITIRLGGLIVAGVGFLAALIKLL